MAAIIRQVSAIAHRVLLYLLLFGLLTPPFGLRAYLEAQAQGQADRARVASVVERPPDAGGAPEAATPRPFAESPPRSALDGIKGKGGWFMIFSGDWTDPDRDRAQALVDSAVRADLSHIYVRVADSRRHFYGTPGLKDLLPLAHARGLSVLGWIEPELQDAVSDAADAIATARFRAEGQRLDGLALTIEGNYDESSVAAYFSGIRAGVGDVKGLGAHYLIIASTFPVPSQHRAYPYATMSRYAQVFAPMAYWRATGLPQFTGSGGVRTFLSRIFQEFRDPAVNPFSRPLSITAQAYDATLESGVPGSPPVAEIVASMEETRAQGGLSWSFYRLPDADNGVTPDESGAITAYPFWQRPGAPGVAGKVLISATNRPVAH